MMTAVLARVDFMRHGERRNQERKEKEKKESHGENSPHTKHNTNSSYDIIAEYCRYTKAIQKLAQLDKYPAAV